MDRRTFSLALAGFFGSTYAIPLWAMGPADKFAIAQLKYGPSDNPRPSALRRLLLELEKRTSVETATVIPRIKASDAQLFEYPMLMISGDRKFEPFDNDTIDRLRTYALSGGFIVVDSAEGVMDGPFMQSIRREMNRIFPDRKVSKIPTDHVLYKSFFLIKQPVGRLSVSDSLEGVFDSERLLAVISHNDMAGAWARDNFGSWKYECTPGGENQREMAYRLGMNLAMYALCINYKADQVHVPFILKRRKWKVE